MILDGPFYSWTVGSKTRRYAVITLPFNLICEVMEVRPFNGATGSGEQRVEKTPHVRNLGAAILDGSFTPTAWSANLPSDLQSSLQIDNHKETYRLELNDGKMLSQTDGGHRRASLLRLRDGAVKRLTDEKQRPSPDAQVIAESELLIDDINNLPITCLLYLDGSPQVDFVNLQRGVAVDKSTMFVLETLGCQYDDPAYKMAIQLATSLHVDKGSPFCGNIKLDSGSKCWLPISTLAARGASDLSTSLIGLANVGIACGMQPSKLVSCVTRIYKVLGGKYPELLEAGKPLTPIKNRGTLGASTMWVGLGILLAYSAQSEALDAHAEELAESAFEVLRDEEIQGSFTSVDKRKYVGRLAQHYFTGREDNFEEGFHDGIPLGLLLQTSATSYAVSKLNKSQKEKKVAAR